MGINESAWRALALSGAIGVLLMVNSARADSVEEKQKIARCAKDICSIIVSKNPKGPDLSCDLTKTWEKDEIQKGADAKSLSWGLGSARCSVKLYAKRADIAAALTSPRYTLKIEKQSIACEIGSNKYPVSLTMAPELKFKNGVNIGAGLHVDDIKGAVLITGVVWTAAAFERHFDIFEGDILREVNRFVQKECPKFVNGAK
ncbi:MAG: hypothetical protein ACLP7P_03355 [Rhodomicrobium sp.]